MTRPTPFSSLPPDAQTDAIAWHRDHRDVSGEQKLDLIAAVSQEAYERAHAALDAILGPLMVPLELEMRSEHDRLVRMWISLGESIGRFVFRRAHHTGTSVPIAPAPLGRLVDDGVVEMTEGEVRAWLARDYPDWDEPVKADSIHWLRKFDGATGGIRYPDSLGRRVRIVPERSGARRWGVWCPNKALADRGDGWCVSGTRNTTDLSREQADIECQWWQTQDPRTAYEVRPYPIGAEAP